jgi:hypothetical protein
MDDYVEGMVKNLKNVFKKVFKLRNFRMNKAKIRHDRKIRPKKRTYKLKLVKTLK